MTNLVRISFAVFIAVLFNACSPKPQLVYAEGFIGEVDGKKTGLYTLKSSKMAMQVTNFGGRVVSLFVPLEVTAMDYRTPHRVGDAFCCLFV
jgi:hypothetical protein